VAIPIISTFREDERFTIKTLNKSFFLNPTQRDQFLVNIEKHAKESWGNDSHDYLMYFLEIAEKKEVSSVEDLLDADLLVLATTNSTWVNGMTPEVCTS